MTIRGNFATTTVLVTVAGLAATVSARAGGDKIVFPAEYTKGVVYMTLDRPENKQVREYFAAFAEPSLVSRWLSPSPDITLTLRQFDMIGRPRAKEKVARW
jgi:hypothetical protein